MKNIMNKKIFDDYKFYIQIMQNLDKILNITKSFNIYISPLPSYCGIQIKNDDDLLIGDLSLVDSRKDNDLLLNNLAKLDIMNIRIGDIAFNLKSQQLQILPITLKEINIIHNIKNFNKTVNDYVYLFDKIPFCYSLILNLQRCKVSFIITKIEFI